MTEQPADRLEGEALRVEQAEINKRLEQIAMQLKNIIHSLNTFAVVCTQANSDNVLLSEGSGIRYQLKFMLTRLEACHKNCNNSIDQHMYIWMTITRVQHALSILFMLWPELDDTKSTQG